MKADDFYSRNRETNKKPMQGEIQHSSPHFPLLSVHWGQKVQYINTKTSKHNTRSHCCILTFPNVQISRENKTMLKFPKALFSLAFITNTLALVYPQISHKLLREHSSSTLPKTHSIYRLWLHTCFSHSLSPFFFFFAFFFFFYCNRTMPVQISADWTCCFRFPLPFSKSGWKNRAGIIYPLWIHWSSWPCTACLQPVFKLIRFLQ